DRRLQLRVTRVRRQRPGEVDEIAVEVDVFLGDARLVCETPGILRVEKHDGGVPGQARPAAQPRELRAGPGVTLDAVRAAADGEHARRVSRPQHRNVEVQRLAGRPALGRVLVTG